MRAILLYTILSWCIHNKKHSSFTRFPYFPFLIVVAVQYKNCCISLNLDSPTIVLLDRPTQAGLFESFCFPRGDIRLFYPKDKETVVWALLV